MFKNLVAAAGLTLASLSLMAGSASAITLNPANSISDGNLSNLVADSAPYNVLAGPYFWGAAFDTIDLAGQATFRFTNTSLTTLALGASVATVLQGFGGVFGGPVTLGWIGGGTDTTPGGTPDILFANIILLAGQTATLFVSYGDPTAFGASHPGIQLQVAGTPVVPIPAALPLLATALLGMGALARRRKAAN